MIQAQNFASDPLLSLVMFDNVDLFWSFCEHFFNDTDLRPGKVYDLASGEGTEGRKLYQLEEEEKLS